MTLLKFYKGYDCLKHIMDMYIFILEKNGIKCDIENVINTDDNIWIGIFNSGNFPKKFIMVNTEPLNLDYYKNILKDVINNSLFIIDYSYGNENIYKDMNISNYFILPVAYCAYHEQINIYSNLSVNQDIDILFYGALTDRRKNFLNALKPFLNKNNINILVRDNDLYDYKEKSYILSRTKIVITIASRDPKILKTNDMFRLSFLLSNKIFFIAEKIGDTIIEDDIFGDYIEYYSKMEELQDKILYYIKNEEKRKDKANKLYEYSKLNYNIENLFPIEKIKLLI